MHPMLTQGLYGPAGMHERANDDYRFPHKDEQGVCWIPEEYTLDNDEEIPWNDYENPFSQLDRAGCEDPDNAWWDICDPPLRWAEVDCNIYNVQDEDPAALAEVDEEEEETGGWLPAYVVYPVLFASWLWEMQLVFMVTLPWWFGLFVFALFDYVLDFVFWLLFGWYCSFCAGLFIWIVNLIHLPFTLLGWIQRIFLETFSFFIDGWMLFFGGSGCYLFIGYDCLLPSSSMYWILDIPWFTSDVDGKFPGTSLLATMTEHVTTIPEVNSFEEFWQIRSEHRKSFNQLIPGLREIQAAFDFATKTAFAL